MRRLMLLPGGVVLAVVALAPAPAQATARVIGSGFGRLCYEYARAGHASEKGGETCNKALAARWS